MNGSLLASRLAATLLSPSGPRGRLAVFTYHQVVERRDPFRPGEPDPEQFRNDLGVIGRLFDVLPLPEAAARLAEGRLPARAACITFDDGYANNHSIAAPLLEAAGLPATFFIATGAIDDGVMWNDLVIEAVAHCGDALVVDPELELDVVPRDRPSMTYERLASLLERLKYRSLERRWEAAIRLYRDNVRAETPQLMMTREQVADLARRGFDIGGHTVRHPILAELDDDGAKAEIEGCRRWIEEVTGRSPTTFAYPNGRPNKDFKAAHRRMVEDAGFSVAVTTEWGFA